MNKTIKNNILSRFLNSVFILVLVSLLGACGGGGGGGGTPTLTVSDVAVAEGNSGTTDMTFTLTLSAAAGSGASVAYATSDGSATAGTDYDAGSGTQGFTAGASSATITITVNGDTSIEDDESLVLTLSSPSGVSLGATTLTATGTISNDDNGGYYDGSASINVPSGSTLTINDPDLKAIFDNDRFFLMSVADDLFYNGTITSRNGNAYTASVRIYKDGVFARTATVSGTSIAGSSVAGTISGTGDYASGTFNLTYSLINTRAPLVFANSDSWDSGIPFPVILSFNSNAEVDIELRNPSSFDIQDCNVIGATLLDVNSEQPGRIRSFSGAFTGCSNVTVHDPVQGYFTSFDGSADDDSILFVIFNDSDSQIDIVNKI